MANKTKPASSEKHIKILNHIEDLHNNHPARKSKFIYMAWAKKFYDGEQYTALDEKTMTLKDVKLTRETRSIYNMIKVFTDLYVSKMIMGDPIPLLKPHGGNIERHDLDVCKVANALVQSWWTRQNWRKKLRELIFWGTVTGIAPAKMYWDDDVGEEYVLNPTGFAELNMEEKSGTMRLGEMVVEVLVPHKEYYPDPVAKDDSGRREALHVFAQAKSVVEERFGKPEDYFVGESKYQQEQDEDSATISGDTYETDEQVEDSDIVFVKMYYEAGNNKHPNGRRTIVVNKEVLEDEYDNQHIDGKIPIYTFKIGGVPDEYYGKGKVYPSIDLQRDFNKAVSCIMENIDWMTVVKWEANINSITLDKNKLDNSSGEVLKSNDGNSVRQIPIAPLPQHLISKPNDIFRHMQILWGLPDVDMGNIPYRGTGTSGVVIDELKESSEMIHDGDRNAIFEFLRETVMDYLKTVQDKYDVNEMVAIIGENFRSKIEKFKKSELLFDMEVKLGQGFGSNPANKFSQLLQMVQQRQDLMSTSELRQAIADNLNIDVVLANTQKSEEKARAHLDQILDGNFEMIPDQNNPGMESLSKPLVSMWDDHPTHIRVFREFIFESVYDTLEMETRKAIDIYISRCKDFITQQMQMAQGQAGNQPTSAEPPNKSLLDKRQAESRLHMATGFPSQNQQTQEPVS